MDILTPAILIIGFIALAALQLRRGKEGYHAEENAKYKAQAEQMSGKIGELQQQLEAERSRKDEISGKATELKESYINLKKDYETLSKERDDLRKTVNQFESEEARREKEVEKKITELDSARASLADERARVIKEDEERIEQEIAERDRLWNDHETNVNAMLNELCKLPQLSFTTFDNTNLPDGFDGTLKPDFMIEFLDQYVIFDSKVSRSDNFQNYITTNVKSTAKKLKGNTRIYPTVFFVVPTEAIAELKKTDFYEQGISFFVISPEAIPPVLHSLKKITSYELAEQMDPQERENIVSLIADLDSHINFQNGVNLIMTKRGAEVLNKAHQVNHELMEEVGQKKDKMRLPNLNPSEIKRLHSSTAEQENAIMDLVDPQASVSKKALEKAKSALKETP